MREPRGRGRWLGAIGVVVVMAVIMGACSNPTNSDDGGGGSGSGTDEPQTYTVSFDRQAGTGGSTSVTVTLGLQMPAALAPTKGAAVFDGYYLQHYSAPDGTGTQYYTAAMESAREWDIPTDVELVAHWAFQIGDAGPAGGIVFYDKGEYTDGWRYLEAWTADEDGTYQWKTDNTSTPGTSTEVGSGYDNTYSGMTGAEHPAAEVVRNATHGGYNDWFLPSSDELDQMYLQSGGIGGFASTYYWTSSEHWSRDSARIQTFDDGDTFYWNKDNDRRVRAARAF